MTTITHMGWLAVIGRPNVGKSTLFNALLGRSLSIVTRKAQTTQSRIMGVVTTAPHQYVLLDTPGVQNRLKQRRFAKLNRVAEQATYEADVALFVVDCLQWRADDMVALETLSEFKGPCIAVMNKYDRCAHKVEALARYREQLQQRYEFASLIMLSAQAGYNMELLHTLITEYLPKGEAMYAGDEITSHSIEFVLAEILRSKLLLLLHEEVPYNCQTQVEQMQDEGKHWLIHAVIWVPTSAKKAVVIGKGGQKLQQIAQQARLAMAAYLAKPVVLKSWVKVGRLPEADI